MEPETPTYNLFFALHEAIAVKDKNCLNCKAGHV